MDRATPFDNWSIGGKIRLAFALTGMLFLFVILLYHTTLFATLQAFDRLEKQQGALARHAENLHLLMLDAHRQEHFFLSRHDLKDVDQWRETMARLFSEIDTLATLEKNDSLGDGWAATIRQPMETYQEVFLQVVAAWQDKGLDHQSGHQGRFRETIHAVETEARHFNTSGLYLTLLQIRRAEKDLGLRRDALYQKRVEELAGRFLAMVGHSSLDDAVKDQLTADMKAYLAEFAPYAQAVLGGLGIDGGKGPFRDIAHRLEVLIHDRHIPEMEVDILELRRREKDYLLRGDAHYVAMVNAALVRLRENIASSGIPDARKASIAGKLDDYEKDFLALVELNDRIIHMSARLRQAKQQVEPIVAAHRQAALTAMKEQAEATRQEADGMANKALLIMIGALTVALLSALALGRWITRPLVTLMAIAEMFTGDERIGEPEARDEVALLAGAMGRMAGHLEHTISQIEEQGEALEEAVRQQDGTHAAADVSQQAGQILAIAREIRDLAGQLRSQ